MYDEIMKSSLNYLFEGFPDASSEGITFRQRSDIISRSDNDKIRENEWMQEYHIIYNSYILDGND